MAFPINATFIDEITYDIVPQYWSKKDWSNDLDNMKNVGINTLVIMRSIFYGKMIYDSDVFNYKKTFDYDFIDFILSEAQKRDMKVFIGLHIKDLTWGDGDYEYELKQNKIFIKEILDKYEKYSSFIGWYIPHEAGSLIYNFKETLDVMCKYCKEVTPDKLVIISPFFRGQNYYPQPLTPKETYDVWDVLFKDSGEYIDICAFQDGTCLLSDYEAYFNEAKKICDKYNVSLWANIETFERDEKSTFPPIDFDVLKHKISMAKKYVSGMITFEFSHFLSPNSIYEKAKENNKLYIKEYK